MHALHTKYIVLLRFGWMAMNLEIAANCVRLSRKIHYHSTILYLYYKPTGRAANDGMQMQEVCLALVDG